MDESQFHSFKYDLVKVIKLLEEIKANQPVPYYPPIVYYPPVYDPWPQPYIPCPEPYVPYQPYTTGGTVNTDSDKDNPTGNERLFPV